MTYTAIRIYKDKPLILDHLLRLPLNDRYLRFCNTLSDEGIAKYVDQIDLRSTQGEACFVVFDDDKNVTSDPIKEPEYIKPYFSLRMASNKHVGTDYLHEIGKRWNKWL